MPPSTPTPTPKSVAVIRRLDDITTKLVALYGERPTVTHAYYTERARVMKVALEQAMSVTAARDYTDRQTVEFKYQLDTCEAEILCLAEERDHLRFTLNHLG